MAENGSEFDGSELEQTQEQASEPSSQQTEAGKSVEQPSQQATAELPQQQAQPGIPEQFRDYTPEQWFNEWNKTNSALGRYKQEITGLRQQVQTISSYLPQIQNRQPAVPTSLPGQEAKQGQEDLTSKYWEDPIPVLEQVVGKVARGVLQENQQQQAARAQQAQQQRQAAIESVSGDELNNIRLEIDKDFTPEHEALMKALDMTDPETNALAANPNVTEKQIRDATRKLFDRADKILKGQMTDPEKIRVLNQAQKLAAANGALGPKAGASMNQATDNQVPDNWKFLLTGQ